MSPMYHDQLVHFVAIVNQCIEGSLQDITARAETYRQLRLMADNDPAIALYTSLGYAPHYEYHYRSPGK